MQTFSYWPYDELTLKGDLSAQKIEVKTPWLGATLQVKADDQENVHELMEKFEQQTLAGEDLPLVNWFFQHFSAHPFCYILPNPKNGAMLDHHGLEDATLLDLEITDFLKHVVKDSPELLAAANHIASELKRETWAWDRTAAIGFASVDGKVSPESLFSVARRFHMLDVVELNNGSEVFQAIEALTGENFARAAGLMVRQNHYVTQHCQEALSPALKKAQQAHELVQDFMAEENGHDKILGVAMRSFADDPESVAVSPYTRVLMHLLRFAAERNFLAFAMVVDFFERSTYEKVDPLAKLLAKGGFDQAARQINRHKEINDAGGHENTACGFLQFMAPCDEAYAQEALLIAELVTLVMNSVPRSALDLFYSN